jgi:hypothetical protein
MKKVLLAVAVLAIGFFTAYPAQAFGGNRGYKPRQPVYVYQHQHTYHHGHHHRHVPRYVYHRVYRPAHVYHESRHHDNTVPALLGGVVIGSVIGSALR